jgi:hypothetical protein
MNRLKANRSQSAIRSENRTLRKALEAILEGAISQGAHTGMSWEQCARIAKQALQGQEPT